MPPRWPASLDLRSVARPTRICARSREVGGVGPQWILYWWCIGVGSSASCCRPRVLSAPAAASVEERARLEEGWVHRVEEGTCFTTCWMSPRCSLGTRHVLLNVWRDLFRLEYCAGSHARVEPEQNTADRQLDCLATTRVRCLV
jgi:hypothetical protein